MTLTEPGRFALTEHAGPGRPGPREVLVDVHRIGICGTDLHAFHGRQPFFEYPRVLGHELGVTVLDVGADVTSVRPGDRCAVRPYLECGRCDTCRRGSPNCCPDLMVLGVHVDGGMLGRLLVPERNLHPSRSLSHEQLALVETLSVGAHAVARGAPTSTDRVLVVGAGPIGLSVIAGLHMSGLHAVLAERDAERREFAATWTDGPVVAPHDEAVSSIAEAFGGDLPTLVFDATGNAASMASSYSLVAHGGRLVFVGLVAGEIAFQDSELHRRELTLITSRNATAADFERTLGALESGAVDVDAWLTAWCKLDDVAEAFPMWARGDTSNIKAMVHL